MKSSKNLWKIIFGTVIPILIGVAVFMFRSHEIVRCYFVRWSYLENIAPNLYIDPDLPETQQHLLLMQLAQAKERIALVYGEYTANPIIIAGHTMEVMKIYGGNSYNRAGRSSFTPIASFIVLGPDGVRDLDILSHELAHAEFSARIGYWKRIKIPNWFDEGLAVQFDGRYSESEWQTRTDDGKNAPDLDQIGVITHDDRLGYLTAKHEVKRWLDIVGQEGFQAFIQFIRNGADFQEAYRAAELSFSTSQ